MANKTVEVIAALTSPVSKLIDAMSKCIGCLYEPHKIKRIADAEAYKIKTISGALLENGDLPIEYEDDKLKVSTLEYGELQKRAAYRFVRIETQRQYNIENIADKAYDILENNESCPQEEISSDWMLRFISSAQDISNNDIQEIWAKILAGEIKRPNSFSFKTLETLKNISQLDAIMFSKACSLIINSEFIPNNIEILEKHGISYFNILRLDELGLINSSGLISKTVVINGEERPVLKSKKYLCLASGKGEISMQIFKLTLSATELYSVIDFNENEEFIKDYAKTIKNNNKNILITLHKINSEDSQGISYDEVDLLNNE